MTICTTLEACLETDENPTVRGDEVLATRNSPERCELAGITFSRHNFNRMRLPRWFEKHEVLDGFWAGLGHNWIIRHFTTLVTHTPVYF